MVKDHTFSDFFLWRLFYGMASKKIQIRALVKFKGGRFQSTSLLWLLFEGSKVHFCVKPNSVELSWGCIEVELELWKNLITRQKFRGRRDQTMFYQSQNLSKLKEDLCFSLCSWSLHEHAREAFMSMLVRLSWAPVLMKGSWACSWSLHAHVRVKLSRARPLYRIMQLGTNPIIYMYILINSV